jgi:acetoin utilization protein AcuB
MEAIPHPPLRRKKMLVKYWMNKEVITIRVGDSMHEAIDKMKHHSVSMFPVMKKGRLVGVVSDRDLKKASASDATALEKHELEYLLYRIRVLDIMTRNPITVSPDDTLEEAAARLLINDISGAPVVDVEGLVVGTISQREIFMALVSLSGYGKQGLQLALEIDDRPGSIKEVTDIIQAYGGRLASILTSASQAADGYKHLYTRIFGIDRRKVTQLLDHLRETATLLYMVDHRENKREEFTRSSEAA